MAAGAQEQMGVNAGRMTSLRPRLQVLTLGVLIGIVTILTGAAVAVTLPPPPDALDQLYPLKPGTTWVYAVTVNGEDAGQRQTQVLNAAQTLEVEGGTEARAVQDRYDQDPVTGEPSRHVSYLAHRDQRLLLLGERDDFGYLQSFPPRVAYQAPLVPGTTWSWSDEFDAEHTVATTLVGLEDVDVAGQTFADCQHLRRTRTSSFADPEVTEEWVCPGVGPVRRVNTATGREEVLVAFRGAGASFGDGAVFAPAEPAEGVAVVGTDVGRSQAAQGRLDAARPQWTLVHKEVVQFPAVLRGDIVALADEGGTVSVLDVRTGTLQWRHRVPDPVVAAPVIAGDVLLVADAEGALRGLDLATGATRWWRELPGLVTALTADGDTAIVAARDRTVRGFGVSDGAQRWTVTVPGVVTATPAVGNGIAVVGDETGAVTALAIGGGAVVWDRTLDGPVVAGPAISGDTAVVGDDSGTLSVVALADGAVRWSEYVDVGIAVSPAVTPESILVHGGDVLRAYATDTGDIRWEAALAEAVETPPVVVGNQVVVLTTAAELVTFTVADGRRTGGTLIPSPSPEAGVLATRPLVVGSDTLLVQFESTPPYAFTFLTAYPLTPVNSAGVYFTGAFRQSSSPPVAPPVLTGDDLVVATELGGVELVSASGPPRALLPDGGVTAYAVLAGDRVIAHKDQELVAVPLGGGDPLWRQPAGEPILGSTAVVTGDVVVAPSEGGATLTGVDVASGEVLWSLPTGTPGTGRPLLLPDGDVVYGTGGLARIDPVTGLERWRIAGVEALAPMAAAGDSIVVAGTVDGEDTLFAVDAADGQVRWEYTFTTSDLAGPVVAGDVVIAAQADGFVGAVDIASGELLWTTQLGTRPSGSPAVLGDVVVLGEEGRPEDFNAADDRYLALDVATGRYLGSYQPFATTGTPLYPAFSVVDGQRIALWHIPDLMILTVHR